LARLDHAAHVAAQPSLTALAGSVIRTPPSSRLDLPTFSTRSSPKKRIDRAITSDHLVYRRSSLGGENRFCFLVAHEPLMIP
jgi:hypothetical protein